MNSDTDETTLQREPDNRTWYQQEPWLAMCLACFLPLIAAVYAPQPLKTPLLLLCGALFVASMVMLSRQARAK
jgi:hypothetical protein